MNWYKNLKIKTKFLISFVLILTSFLFAGVLAFGTIFKIVHTYNQSMADRESVIETCTNVVEKLVNARNTLINVSLQDIPVSEMKKQIEQPITDAWETISDFVGSLEEALPSVSDVSAESIIEQIELCQNAMSGFENYVTTYISFLEAVESGDKALEVKLDNELTVIGDTMFEHLFELPNISFKGLVNETFLLKDESLVKTAIIGAIFVLSIIISVLLAIYLSTSIRKPIAKLSADSETISKGNLDVSIRIDASDEIGELSNSIGDMADVVKNILDDINTLSYELSKGNCSYFINSSKYQGAFKEVIDAINNAVKVLIEDTIYTIDRIQEFSNGDFSTEIKKFPGEKEAIKLGLDSVKNALQLVSGDITDLVNAANEGNLEFKLDTEKYQGQWKETCIGLNSFVDNVVIPIKETQNALNQFAKGNFSHRITNEYKGEFNEIKKTVNFTAETIGLYISEISETLTRMAHKDFNVSIDNEYLGDFKEIQSSVNNIVSNLNILVKDIISSAEQVNAGAKQISESSISLAEGATEQAEAVENLTNTAKLISQQAIKNAENSEKANDLALKTKENAASGSEQMNSMLTAMEEINNASSSISNIIKVIDDIAFQTNILALNAAVEAARAGEHGKGFAVVAEEVRSLAARSQEAAKETTELIQSSVDKVEEGSKIANNTADSLLVIVNQIEEISHLVESCALSSKEQEKSIEQMTKGITQIESVTQDNTATSEESAAASQELASQAEVFYTSVSDFTLKEDNNNYTTNVKTNNVDFNALSDAAITIDDELDFGKY